MIETKKARKEKTFFSEPFFCKELINPRARGKKTPEAAPEMNRKMTKIGNVGELVMQKVVIIKIDKKISKLFIFPNRCSNIRERGNVQTLPNPKKETP